MRELGLKKNTKKYHNAIPDAVRGNTFFEFKNANYVSKTKQFQNYEKSVNRGVRLNLYVRPWTVVSKSVRALVEKSNGKIYRR
uniref:putative toxin n=1 Tax=Exiguobacterium sp. S3-2 TaxID=1389960 RepID=UPI001565560B|nr:putative toxin [Exiguobacterium sp. S3-2]